MILRNVLTATAVGAVALAWSGPSDADEYGSDEYQANEFLGLDLSQAVLSPKPLGPATSFAPGPLDVTVDGGTNRAHANAEPEAVPKIAPPKIAPRIAAHNTRIANPRPEPPRLLAQTKLAHHHRNPLDAQALDARIQAWPCKSGGICNWKR
jgi:hypothetical protein